MKTKASLKYFVTDCSYLKTVFRNCFLKDGFLRINFSIAGIWKVHV